MNRPHLTKPLSNSGGFPSLGRFAKGYDNQVETEVARSRATGDKVGGVVGDNNSEYHFVGISCAFFASKGNPPASGSF